jgi:hypothetical protein
MTALPVHEDGKMRNQYEGEEIATLEGGSSY